MIHRVQLGLERTKYGRHGSPIMLFGEQKPSIKRIESRDLLKRESKAS